jgi:hypothetical protein
MEVLVRATGKKNKYKAYRLGRKKQDGPYCRKIITYLEIPTEATKNQKTPPKMK